MPESPKAKANLDRRNSGSHVVLDTQEGGGKSPVPASAIDGDVQPPEISLPVQADTGAVAVKPRRSFFGRLRHEFLETFGDLADALDDMSEAFDDDDEPAKEKKYKTKEKSKETSTREATETEMTIPEHQVNVVIEKV